MTTLEVLNIASQRTELGIKVAASGYISRNGKRISLEDASAICGAAGPKLPYQFQKLNQATRDFFFNLCEAAQELTRDHQLDTPFRVGKHGIPVQLANGPRLSNLKRSGVINGFADPSHKSHKYLQLTEEGRSLWLAHLGA